MQIKTRRNSMDVSVKRHNNSVRVSLWSLTYLAGKLTRRSISRVQKNSVSVSLWSAAYVMDKTDPPVHLSHPGHKDPPRSIRIQWVCHRRQQLTWWVKLTCRSTHFNRATGPPTSHTISVGVSLWSSADVTGRFTCHTYLIRAMRTSKRHESVGVSL